MAHKLPLEKMRDGSYRFVARENRDKIGMDCFRGKILVTVSDRDGVVAVLGHFSGRGIAREGEKLPTGKGVVTHQFGNNVVQFHTFEPLAEKEALKIKRALNAEKKAHGGWLDSARD